MTTEGLVVVPPVQGEDTVLTDAQHLDVTGPETMALAIEMREGVKALIAEIDAAFRPHIQRAHALHKGLTTELNTRSTVPCQALDLLTAKIGHYEIARQQAEEQERRRQAEVQAREAAERREAEAQHAALVSPQQAEDVRAMPLDAFAEPVTAVATVAPKVKGVAVSVSYEAQVTDLAALVAFAHGHPGLLSMVVQANQAGLDALVKQQGATFSIPGVSRVAKAPVVRSTRR